MAAIFENVFEKWSEHIALAWPRKISKTFKMENTPERSYSRNVLAWVLIGVGLFWLLRRVGFHFDFPDFYSHTKCFAQSPVNLQLVSKMLSTCLECIQNFMLVLQLSKVYLEGWKNQQVYQFLKVLNPLLLQGTLLK